VGGLKITIEGARSASTMTGSNGRYTFAGLPKGGSYTIKPKKDTINFAPRNRTINTLTQDESADFSGLVQPILYKISGRVIDALTARPLGGVNIRLSGSRDASTTTDANGNYGFSNLPAGGSYTVTPDGRNMSLTPRDHSIRNLMRDEAANFSRSAQECSQADKDRETKSIIDKYSAGWRRSIEAERRKIITDNMRDGAGNAEASLGEITYQPFFKGCRMAIVTARYRWQITMSSPAAPPRVLSLQKQKIIPCFKTGEGWSCP
jgi:hypothetical protein